jgi:hypothetical protein
MMAEFERLGWPTLPPDHPIYSEGPSITILSHTPERAPAKPTASPLGAPSGSNSRIKYFKVHSDENGRLSAADFVAPRTRAETYIYIGPHWSDSPDDLVEAMKQCPPLGWRIHGVYADVREEMESELKGLSESDISCQRKLKALKTRLKTLPAEPEKGALHWLYNMTRRQFERQIVPAVEKWLADEPNWNWEEDYFPVAVTAGDAAYRFFLEMSFHDLATLGVEVIEGQCPGNDYYAAELRRGVRAANRSAEAAGIPVRFRKAGK